MEPELLREAITSLFKWVCEDNSKVQRYQMPISGRKHRRSIEYFDYPSILSGFYNKRYTIVRLQVAYKS